VLVLSGIEGMTAPEIAAAVTATPLNTVDTGCDAHAQS